MKKILKDESGIALITALLIMVLLMVLGTAAIMTSTTDVKIGQNFKKSSDAFYLAEAGLETGLAYLDSNFDSTTGWNAFVIDGFVSSEHATYASGTEITASPGLDDITALVTNTVGSETFTIYTRDNSDDSDCDPGDKGDCDGRIYLMSVGTLTGTIASTTTLETLIEFDQPYESYGGKDLTSGNTNVASGEATWSN